MTRNFSPGGLPGPGVFEYYERRARQVGLIISEGMYIPHPSAGTYRHVPEWSATAAVSAWQPITAAVHAQGARIIAQLWHVGGVRRPSRPPIADAPVVSPSGRDLKGITVGEPLTVAEIDALVDDYAAAASAAMAAGFDGVEIHAAHGYLIDQFHWVRTNERTDAFGGDIGRRSVFGALVTQAVREALGPEPMLSYRFSQWKLHDYEARLAANPQELARILEPISAAGVDVLHASTRRYWEPAFEGSTRTLSGWTKHLTGLPVIGVGSVGVRSAFRDEVDDAGDPVSLAPLLALVEAGEFDLVALGRALLSDPAWPSKVREGRLDDIRWYQKAHEAVLD